MSTLGKQPTDQERALKGRLNSFGRASRTTLTNYAASLDPSTDYADSPRFLAGPHAGWPAFWHSLARFSPTLPSWVATSSPSDLRVAHRREGIGRFRRKSLIRWDEDSVTGFSPRGMLDSGIVGQPRSISSNPTRAPCQPEFGLYYIRAEELLGDDGEGSVDGTHPTDLCFVRMSQALVRVLRPLLGPRRTF